MEQTLGKRIVSYRKKLGLTQDQLAEKLGVTAQAVSKWENDLSCPDITMLPRLAAIFGISTDTLLGVTKEKVHEAEIVPPEDEEDEEDGLHMQKGGWEFRWEPKRNEKLGFAVLVLLVGGLMLAAALLNWEVTFWQILWPSCLLVFGLFGLFPKFSFFRLGCMLFGAYSLLANLDIAQLQISKQLLFPIIIILFGCSLLVDSLRKPKKHHFHIHHNNKNKTKNNFNISSDKFENSTSFDISEDSFDYCASFGEAHRDIRLAQLRSGSISTSFGSYTVDLSGVENVLPGCSLDANCSFGELTILVPSRYQVNCNSSTSFSGIDINGHPDGIPAGVIELDANCSFGQISIKYI